MSSRSPRGASVSRDLKATGDFAIVRNAAD